MNMGRIAAAVALALGAVLASTPSASAGQDIEVRTTDDNPGGAAWFNSYGEHFAVCDRQWDDLGVRGRLTWTSGGVSHERKVWHHSGHHTNPNLNCTKYGPDINIPEGTKVTLQVCLQKEKGATLRFCKSKTGVA